MADRRQRAVDERIVRRRAEPLIYWGVVGRSRSTTAIRAPATTCIRTRWSRSIRKPGSSAGTTSTPHELWDYDGVTEASVDIDYQGRRRKVIIHADRSGHFYASTGRTASFCSRSRS
jgi:glucose dehydrogenase